MWASLVAALVSALCYGVASVMQAVAVRSASRRPARIQEGDPAAARVDPGLLVRLLGQWRFLASLLIDIVGSWPSSWRCGGCRYSPCRP